MNDFDYDVMQKKRIAARDRHRKNGSKSRKCGLPSDHLTPAQIRRMSGPVRTYQMNRPMRWGEFKGMPEDLQKQYLEHLRLEYTATNEMLAHMLSVNVATVQRARDRLGVAAIHPHLTNAEKLERTKKWSAFLYGKDGQAEETAEEAETREAEEAPHPAPMEIAQISAAFTGAFQPESLASWLAALPIHGTPEVRVRVEVEIL